MRTQQSALRGAEGLIAEIPCCDGAPAELSDFLIDRIPEAVWLADATGALRAFNRQWRDHYALPGRAACPWWEMLHPGDVAPARLAWAKSLRSGSDLQLGVRVPGSGGTWEWALLHVRASRLADGSVGGWVGSCTDMDQSIPDRLALTDNPDLVRQIVDASPDVIQLLDHKGRFLFVNATASAAWKAVGRSIRMGDRWLDHISPQNRKGPRRIFAGALKGRSGRVELQVPGSDGQMQWWELRAQPVGSKSTDRRVLLIGRNVTHLKQAEARVVWTAQHDALTGLPNRTLFQDCVQARIREAELTGNGFALLILDVDNFKQTNDTLGHDAGDALLREFAARAAGCIRPTDFIARLGGDEFGILLCGTASEDEVRLFGDRLMNELRKPHSFSGGLIDCQSSIGAALYPLHGSDFKELMKCADMSLYAAKKAGRGVLSIFEVGIRQQLQIKASMISLARDALHREAITPFYQPKINLRTGELAGFEALLRWRDARGTIQPPAFIEAAFKDHGLARAISDTMIGCVLEDLKRWEAQGLPYRHVAINAAAAEFRSGKFAEDVLARVAAAGLTEAAVQIEVTESVFLGRGAEYVERALETLNRAGMVIALDDFGTGFASLSHLKRFPVDVIKIDQSFVRGLHSDPDNAAIVAAVIGLGRSLNIKVVAEGVESRRQHDTLVGLGCDYGQGYFYSRPMDTSATADRLRDGGAFLPQDVPA